MFIEESINWCTAENMEGISFCAAAMCCYSCFVFLHRVAIHVAQIYSGFFNQPPLMYYISMHLMLGMQIENWGGWYCTSIKELWLLLYCQNLNNLYWKSNCQRKLYKQVQDFAVIQKSRRFLMMLVSYWCAQKLMIEPEDHHDNHDNHDHDHHHNAHWPSTNGRSVLCSLCAKCREGAISIAWTPIWVHSC